MTRSARELCSLLLHGELAADEFPELASEATGADVRARLARCGLALRRRAGRWSAVPDRDGSAQPGHHPTYRMDVSEGVLALVLAASTRNGADGCDERRYVRRMQAVYDAHWVDRAGMARAQHRGYLNVAGGVVRAGHRFAVMDVQYARDLIDAVDLEALDTHGAPDA